jgi:nitrate reductase NapAB chaperone NapD
VGLVITLAPVHAEDKKAALTAMDYIEIQQLVNKYGQVHRYLHQ